MIFGGLYEQRSAGGSADPRPGGQKRRGFDESGGQAGFQKQKRRIVNPGELFGGTWEKIKDRFLLADGDNYHTSDPPGGYTSVEHKHVAPVFASATVGGQTFQGALNVNGNFASSTYGYMAYGSQQTVSTAMQVQHTEFYTGKQINIPSTITDDNMPPYLVVNVWKRTA